MSIIPGSLYIVATPIGNIDDISARAIEVLGSVNLILAEDTRHSGHLLQKLGINTPAASCHEHNERKQVKGILEKLKNGDAIALISDAGTPLVSDPGYSLVVAAHEAGIKVIPIPGPSALIAALSAAGQATDRFVFEGYLPVKKSARQKYLQTLTNETRTLVFYETPHRLLNSLEDFIDCFGPKRMATIAKELTKVHETIYRATLSEIETWLVEDAPRQKGEFVLLIEGAEESTLDAQEAKRVLEILLKSLSVKEATSIATEIVGGNRNELYQLALHLKEKK